jgi:regulating synaptic membrane exocytosis protein 2
MCYSEKSKRRTKTVAGTLEPKWNQTFVYLPMKRAEIRAQSLQITVYDYDRIGSGEYVGEVSQHAFMSSSC